MSDLMFKIHLELLDHSRQDIFRLLPSFGEYGYLAGGTALALQIGHRKSFDFDVFVNQQIGEAFLRKVKKIFGEVKFTLNNPDQINFYTRGGINVTFVFVGYKPLFPLVKTEEISLADLRDIAADKAYTIGRRATWRDYVDVFFILQKDIASLPEVISWAKKKFGEGFTETLFLEQLVYFQDLEVTPIEYLDETPSEEEIKGFLEKKVREYLSVIQQWK